MWVWTVGLQQLLQAGEEFLWSTFKDGRRNWALKSTETFNDQKDRISQWDLRHKSESITIYTKELE